MNILAKANEIVNLRSEEKSRQYGDFSESMRKAAKIASVTCGKKITDKDVYHIMMAVKLSRESYAHKEDNLLDLAAYAGALNNSYVEEKYNPRTTGISDSTKVIMIVGQCPPSKKAGKANDVFLRGRTGKFINQLTCLKPNIVLTNAVNVPYKKLTDELFHQGFKDLSELVQLYRPIKVIALGSVASTMVSELAKDGSFKAYHLAHPRYVLRFNKNIDNYTKFLINLLSE